MQGLTAPSEVDLGTQRGGVLDYLGNLSAQERNDLGYVAALARRGRPKIDKILASEVERASGRLVVTCESIPSQGLDLILNLVLAPGCGPGSLDDVVRKVVSKQIDPARIRRGDLRGSITFYNEEFSF